MCSQIFYGDEAMFCNLIRKNLRQLNSGTRIRVFYDGGIVDLIFDCLTCGTILGRVNDMQIFIDLSEITGFLVLPDEGWVSIAPGQCLPLPQVPAEVSQVMFEAKTDIGERATIILTYEGYNIKCENDLTNIPRLIHWCLDTMYNAKYLAIKNKGPSTVYIRNLDTE